MTYSTAKGSFEELENVACTSSGGGTTKNDNDAGTLILSVADTSNPALPLTSSVSSTRWHADHGRPDRRRRRSRRTTGWGDPSVLSGERRRRLIRAVPKNVTTETVDVPTTDGSVVRCAVMKPVTAH